MPRLRTLTVLLCLGCAPAAGPDETHAPDVGVDALPVPVPAGWLNEVEDPLPRWLSQTGVYSDLPRRTPGPTVLTYEPPHVLWSNGAAKERLLFLPQNTTIDTSGDAWDFPLGTVVVKTFTFSDIEGRTGEVAVETRFIFKRADGWDYGVYHWNQEGTKARLETGNWAEVPLTLSKGGEDFPYLIPGKLDCKACHETQPGPPIIGISAINLDHSLADSGALSPAPPPQQLPGRSTAEERMMSYLLGNCAHCHHGQNRQDDNASYSLLPDDLLENTVNVNTDSSASGIGVRVVPGRPEASALYEATVSTWRENYDGDFKAMPPVGVVLTDPDAAEIIADWIRSL